MSTDQIVAAILFGVVIVIPTLVFTMDDSKWERKKKGDDDNRH
jgi:hypothetical protein